MIRQRAIHRRKFRRNHTTRGLVQIFFYFRDYFVESIIYMITLLIPSRIYDHELINWLPKLIANDSIPHMEGFQ